MEDDRSQGSEYSATSEGMEGMEREQVHESRLRYVEVCAVHSLEREKDVSKLLWK